MLKPPLPLDETARLLSLHSLQLLDTPVEERFDRVTRMAQRLFKVESCLISLVDSERQWFKSRQGLDVCETPREVSFCGHAILGEEIFVVGDASKDPRFADNPLVTGAPHIRFYAGCPVRGPDSHRIGTLCLLDSAPRSFPVEDQESLRDLAAMVEDELQLAAQVTRDELTQIANRRGFNMVADHVLSLCRRNDIDAELLFFDLDGFKQVNDTLGHIAGDKVLQHFAKILIKCFRTADVVARIGGDEFVVLMTAAQGASNKAISRLEKLANKDNREIFRDLSWSVGRIGFDPAKHQNIAELFADADSRMYANKLRRQGAGS